MQVISSHLRSLLLLITILAISVISWPALSHFEKQAKPINRKSNLLKLEDVSSARPTSVSPNKTVSEYSSQQHSDIWGPSNINDNIVDSIRKGWSPSNPTQTFVSEFPKDLQLYPRDTATNLATVNVSDSAEAIYIGIQSFLRFPINTISTDLEIAMAQLEQHIQGTVTLSYTELNDIRDTITNNVSLLETTVLFGNTPIFEYGFQIIQAYESTYGALFTDNGTKTFAASASGDDGLALERAIYELYQGIFDLVDTDLLSTYPDIVDGLAFGSADYFPGSVPSPTDPDTIYEMRINASVPTDWGRPNLYSNLSARRPTGAYLAPGTISEVIVPPELVNSGFVVRVGGHTWDLSSKSTYKRLSRVSTEFPITDTVTQVANPLGGNIYIEVPLLADAGIVTVQFKNTIRSPFFSARSFDQMTNEEWETTERYHPGAWADFESDKVMIHVPSKWIKEYDDPVGIMADYDATMDAVSDYMGKPLVRNKTMVYMQVDVLLRGSAFFPGYPMTNYASFHQDTPQSPLDRDSILDGTFFHEHGHATYMSKFTGETEAAVHMPYVAVATHVYGQSLQEAFSTSLHYYNDTDVSLVDALNHWIFRDSFQNDVNMANNEAGYKHRGHAKYVEIVDLFGWDVITGFNHQLNVEFEETGADVSRNNHDPNDRILRLSREAGVDLRPLIHLWGISPVDQTELKSQLDAEGLLPSVKIYDRMVEYKSTVPLTQAEFDVLHEKMSPVTFHTDWWDGLQESFAAADGEAAIARIDELIDYYFPNGRPIVEPNLATGIIANVGSEWQTVELDHTYASMVVVATPNYDSSDAPAVVRIRNAEMSSFEVKVQNPNDTPLNDYTVIYTVVEEGVYGVEMEAVKVNTSTTSYTGSTLSIPQTVANSYVNPVVVGQVQTANDADWSQFYAHGSVATDPPSSAALNIGKHVAEDTDTNREAETLGYIVIEAGSGTVDDIMYEAGVGSSSVAGMSEAPPYSYLVHGMNISTGVLSSAGFNGTDLGWPVLYGDEPFGSESLNLVHDEDQVGDSERSNTSEQISYLVFGTPLAPTSVSLGSSNITNSSLNLFSLAALMIFVMLTTVFLLQRKRRLSEPQQVSSI